MNNIPDYIVKKLNPKVLYDLSTLRIFLTNNIRPIHFKQVTYVSIFIDKERYECLKPITSEKWIGELCLETKATNFTVRKSHLYKIQFGNSFLLSFETTGDYND